MLLFIGGDFAGVVAAIALCSFQCCVYFVFPFVELLFVLDIHSLFSFFLGGGGSVLFIYA